MRIGYLTYALDRSPAGIGRYASELLQAIKVLPGGPEIVLLTTEKEDRYGLWKQFEHYSLAGCHLLPTLLTLGNAEISWVSKRHKLDLIHDPNGIAPFLGPSLGVRRVVTIHDAFAYVYPEKHNKLDNWRYRWMLPLATRKADMVLTDSQNSLNDIQRYLKVPSNKIRAIPCAVDPRFKPIPESLERQLILTKYGIKRPYLLYVGGINARKNIARLFEAYDKVRETFSDVTLVIGGKRQWQTGEIDATFKRLGLEEHVIFTGYVDDADLPGLYSAAEAFVFPSLYEGFGLPPLEAMACGTPVVTSNVSSLPEVVGEAAIKIDPYNIEALASAIIQVLSNSELKAELRQLGLERSAKFTWERTAIETMQVYEQILGSYSQ